MRLKVRVFIDSRRRQELFFILFHLQSSLLFSWLQVLGNYLFFVVFVISVFFIHSYLCMHLLILCPIISGSLKLFWKEEDTDLFDFNCRKRASLYCFDWFVVWKKQDSSSLPQKQYNSYNMLCKCLHWLFFPSRPRIVWHWLMTTHATHCEKKEAFRETVSLIPLEN